MCREYANRFSSFRGVICQCCGGNDSSGFVSLVVLPPLQTGEAYSSFGRIAVVTNHCRVIEAFVEVFSIFRSYGHRTRTHGQYVNPTKDYSVYMYAETRLVWLEERTLGPCINGLRMPAQVDLLEMCSLFSAQNIMPQWVAHSEAASLRQKVAKVFAVEFFILVFI